MFYLVTSDSTKLEMIMCLMCFIDPSVILDTRILQKIWPHAIRLRRFYDKFEVIDAEVAGPSRANPEVVDGNDAEDDFVSHIYG